MHADFAGAKIRHQNIGMELTFILFTGVAKLFLIKGIVFVDMKYRFTVDPSQDNELGLTGGGEPDLFNCGYWWH